MEEIEDAYINENNDENSNRFKEELDDEAADALAVFIND
jgi:hypothetical protein